MLEEPPPLSHEEKAIETVSIPESSRLLFEQLHTTLAQGQREVRNLRFRAQVSYWLVIVVFLALLTVGLLLIGIPALAFYRGTLDRVPFAILGGAGAIVIAIAIGFQPLERVHGITAQTSYTAMVKDSFHSQMALHLLEVDLNSAASIDRAAKEIAAAAQRSGQLQPPRQD